MISIASIITHLLINIGLFNLTGRASWTIVKSRHKNKKITKVSTFEEAKRKIQKTVDDFQKEIASEGCVDIIWDSTVNKYYKKTFILKNALNNNHIRENISSNVIHNLSRFLDMCQNPEFHIAFVGAIKAGKSTLINALLGQDLASTAVTPETAALTKFKAAEKQNYVNLTFYSQEEWNILWNSVRESKAEVFMQEYGELNAEAEKNNWLNKEPVTKFFDNIEELKEEIKKWTSSKEATHYFVKEVEVGIINSNIPKGVVYVDTPGLDDPVRYRSDITRTYIDRANAVLVCVKSDALTGGELATIYSVFANSRYNPEKIYVVGTQLDTLNRPNENWKEQKQEWMKHLSKKGCFGSNSLAQSKLLSVAAYLYNLIIGYDNLSDDDIFYELEPTASIMVPVI
ncbi:dynamin family protein [Anaerotignum propionicum]|uniref:Dynamin family protein n=1 Tax=Anaerotignum propionicum DSM 1682 TaxID=991789 RepID=A0A0X1U8X0_ANAPI|nr:dynamin family protein [Anaerotignum propionicum]AMJ41397.1 GTPase Era [Anaerotignum propionicum DSM 1682]SHF14643.1 Dynamin family protein [[Clostridium] propionicum DSM 1682] [Anaerotignum propionicum DSM 1682]